VKPFLDTNVLVYAVTNDPRSTRAISVIDAGGVISAQVLNEFTNVLRRKFQRGWPDIEIALGHLRGALEPALPLTIETHAAAVELARDHGLSFYDALIVASARAAGCTTLLSEDMQHGRSFDGVTILNPFL